MLNLIIKLLTFVTFFFGKCFCHSPNSIVLSQNPMEQNHMDPQKEWC